MPRDENFPYQEIEKNKNLMKTMKMKKEIIKELAVVINMHSLENDSNTPDFILAEYLFDCLVAGHLMIAKRSAWYNPEGKEE